MKFLDKIKKIKNEYNLIRIEYPYKKKTVNGHIYSKEVWKKIQKSFLMNMGKLYIMDIDAKTEYTDDKNFATLDVRKIVGKVYSLELTDTKAILIGRINRNRKTNFINRMIDEHNLVMTQCSFGESKNHNIDSETYKFICFQLSTLNKNKGCKYGYITKCGILEYIKYVRKFGKYITIDVEEKK